MIVNSFGFAFLPRVRRIKGGAPVIVCRFRCHHEALLSGCLQPPHTHTPLRQPSLLLFVIGNCWVAACTRMQAASCDKLAQDWIGSGLLRSRQGCLVLLRQLRFAEGKSGHHPQPASPGHARPTRSSLQTQKLAQNNAKNAPADAMPARLAG